MGFIALVVGLVAGKVVYDDAKRLKEDGAKLAPALWALVVFLSLLLAVPVYLILRITTWRRQIEGVTASPLTSA
jgi:hypothetical protein